MNSELVKYNKKYGVEFDKIIIQNEQGKDEIFTGYDCEIVTFCHYLRSKNFYLIPRACLRPATMNDLVTRYQEIGEHVFRSTIEKKTMGNYQKLIDLLLEESYIMNEIWRREKLRQSNNPKNIFLCHASADKNFVRQIYTDLANSGHMVWMDEFEINIGDSIVGKINEANKYSDAIILTMSNSSIESTWVEKEWSAALARYLGTGRPKILPIRIEECEIPPILADIMYADFSTDYLGGLGKLLHSLELLE